MHFRVITETAPEVLTPILIAGGLAAVTIVATMWGANERFRVAMMPFIAILAAYGWATALKLKSK